MRRILALLVLVISPQLLKAQCDAGVVNVDMVQCVFPGDSGVFGLFPGSWSPADPGYVGTRFQPANSSAQGGLYPVGPNSFTMAFGADGQQPPWHFDATMGGTFVDEGGDTLTGDWLLYGEIWLDPFNPNSICDVTDATVLVRFLEEGDTCTPVENDTFWGTAVTTATSGCDGTASLTLYGGTEPFTVTGSGGQATSDLEFTDLCPGFYNLLVQDAAGQVITVEFVISEEENVYTDPAIEEFWNYVDTIYSNALENCDLDYDLPIDSFDITQSILTWDDTLYTEWVAWQQGQPYTLGSSVYLDVDEIPVVLELSIFCMNGRSDVGSFQLFALASTVALGQLEPSVEKETVTVYPNPSTGTIRLASKEQIEEVTVVDNQGRIVQSEQVNLTRAVLNLDVPGHYILHCRTRSGFTRKKVVVSR